MLHPMVLVQKNVSQDSYNCHLVKVTFRCTVIDSQNNFDPGSHDEGGSQAITCL